MKRILFILLLTIPFFGFGQTEYVKEYYENGQLKSEGYQYTTPDVVPLEETEEVEIPDIVDVGLWKYYYENGQLLSEGWYNKGYKHGLWKYYYKSGKIRKEGEYQNGNENGLWKYYYKNGQLKTTRDFYRYTNFKNYHENGQLKSEGYYKNRKNYGGIGEKDGLWKYYYESGQLSIEYIFKEGEEVSRKCWNRDGKEIIECK